MRVGASLSKQCCIRFLCVLDSVNLHMIVALVFFFGDFVTFALCIVLGVAAHASLLQLSQEERQRLLEEYFPLLGLCSSMDFEEAASDPWVGSESEQVHSTENMRATNEGHEGSDGRLAFDEEIEKEDFGALTDAWKNDEAGEHSVGALCSLFGEGMLPYIPSQESSIFL